MRVVVREECGLAQALEGMAYSYRDPGDTEWCMYPQERSLKIANALYTRDNGENKFLESVVVWIEITAPRYWWSQFDTYRIGVTKQSESTMHTLKKSPPTKDMFAADTPWIIRAAFRVCWHLYRADINKLKKCLPESYMQTRMICTNYKALRGMYYQRHSHRLLDWQEFFLQLEKQLAKPMFVFYNHRNTSNG